MTTGSTPLAAIDPTLDALRQRGNTYLSQAGQDRAQRARGFEFELVRDGRSLPHPVNYMLVRIVPPADKAIDPAKPPFIVVDPAPGTARASAACARTARLAWHLPAAHACYFVGFLPEPVAGQTIEACPRAPRPTFIEVGHQPASRGRRQAGARLGNCQWPDGRS